MLQGQWAGVTCVLPWPWDPGLGAARPEGARGLSAQLLRLLTSGAQLPLSSSPGHCQTVKRLTLPLVSCVISSRPRTACGPAWPADHSVDTRPPASTCHPEQDAACTEVFAPISGVPEGFRVRGYGCAQWGLCGQLGLLQEAPGLLSPTVWPGWPH